MKMTIGKQVSFNSGFLCLVIAILSLFAVNRLLALRQVSDSIVNDSLPGMIYSAELNLGHTENGLRLYKMAATKSAEERQKLRQEIEATNAKVLQAMTNYDASIFSAEDRQNFEDFRKKRAAFVQARDQFLSLIATNEAAAQSLLSTSIDSTYKEYSAAADVLLNFNKKEAQARGTTLSKEVGLDVEVIAISAVVALAIGIIASLGAVRKIVGALSRTAETLQSGSSQVVAAASQISGASQSLAEGASEQAASLEETSSSLEEISSMTARNAENAEKSKVLASEARHAADVGTADMQAMNTAMEGIKEASNEIAKIIKTIDEIAFQTNILALNAAVEAARAGEAGMGFAVVAEEVRSLAQRSAQAAKETASKIEGAISRTQEGVVLSAKVTASLHQIVEKVHKVDELVAEVASASREQSQGLGQVTSAIGQMDSVTQNNAASAEESASAAEELNAQAGALNDAVNQLLILTGNAASQLAPAVAQERPTFKTTVQVDPTRKHTQAVAKKPLSVLRGRQTAVLAGGHGDIPMSDDFKDM